MVPGQTGSSLMGFHPVTSPSSSSSSAAMSSADSWTLPEERWRVGGWGWGAVRSMPTCLVRYRRPLNGLPPLVALPTRQLSAST